MSLKHNTYFTTISNKVNIVTQNSFIVWYTRRKIAINTIDSREIIFFVYMYMPQHSVKDTI